MKSESKIQPLDPAIRDTMIILAQKELNNPHRPDARLCDYSGKGIRPVHLEACIWHLRENDPACVACFYKP